MNVVMTRTLVTSLAGQETVPVSTLKETIFAKTLPEGTGPNTGVRESETYVAIVCGLIRYRFFVLDDCLLSSNVFANRYSYSSLVCMYYSLTVK